MNPASLLPRLDGVAVLAGNDLDLRRGHHLVRLHLERRILDDERPHVVAETVRVQVTLWCESPEWYREKSEDKGHRVWDEEGGEDNVTVPVS